MVLDENKVKQFLEHYQNLELEIQQSMIGQKELIRNVLAAMIAGGNILLEGLPGLGKTQLVKVMGKVLDLDFSRIQFTPDLMPADVTGTNIMKDGAFIFQKGPIFSNIVLADEINRATPKTQSALLEAMQERTVTTGGTTYPLPEPFFVLATQNPLEMEGTYPLPEAQMDRFLFKLDVEFPNREELYQIVSMTTGSQEREIKKICDGNILLEMREIAKAVPVAQPVAEYMMDLVLKSHPDDKNAPEEIKKFVRYGSSPRGAQAIMTASRIFALLAGRFNVSFDDIRQAAPLALGHRIFLNFEGISEDMTSQDIIQILLSEGNYGTAR